MAKVSMQSADADEIQPQQVTYYDLSNKHVHWDRVTMVVLTACAVAFWAWGRHASKSMTGGSSESGLDSMFEVNVHPETVALAALPQTPPHAPFPRTNLSFTEPGRGAAIEATFVVRGHVQGVPEGQHLWLITRRDAQSRFWPKERIVPDAGGAFEQKTWDYGPDGHLSLCVLSTTEEDTIRFESWLRVGDRDDEWPALEPVGTRSVVLGCQDVQLRKYGEAMAPNSEP